VVEHDSAVALLVAFPGAFAAVAVRVLVDDRVTLRPLLGLHGRDGSAAVGTGQLVGPCGLRLVLSGAE